MSLLDHMCPKCDNYMPLDLTGALSRVCKNCGVRQEEKKGLVMETVLQGKASEAYKVLLNEYTWEDPRIPHVKTLKCPVEDCPTRTAGATQDVGYIKSDAENLKFIYRCYNCKNTWRSRG